MGSEKTKNIGYLRRLKERLEFKISTETLRLDAEKDLIRKINAVSEELDKSIKSYKMKRKIEFVNGDVEELTKQAEEQEKLIDESDKRLDSLYADLRSMTGFKREQKKHRERKFVQKQAEMPSIMDIAVIKDAKNPQNEKNDESGIEVSSN